MKILTSNYINIIEVLLGIASSDSLLIEIRDSVLGDVILTTETRQRRLIEYAQKLDGLGRYYENRFNFLKLSFSVSTDYSKPLSDNGPVLVNFYTIDLNNVSFYKEFTITYDEFNSGSPQLLGNLIDSKVLEP